MGKKSMRQSVSSAVFSSVDESDLDTQAALECMQQAEICCHEARLAARMKRLRAACGLFETAQNLLRQAVKASGNVRIEATEKLSQIAAEAAIYSELACRNSRTKTPQAIPIRTPQHPRERR